MSRAVFLVLLKELVRDRGALVMAFLLPVAFFLIFALIFADAGSENLVLKLALFDPTESEANQRLVSELEADGTIERVGEALDPADVRALVASGEADVGLVLRDDPARPGERAPFLVIAEPTRSIAVGMLMGRVETVWNGALADVAIGRFMAMVGTDLVELTEEQQLGLDRGLMALRNADNGASAEGLFAREEVVGEGRPRGSRVLYYAGAIMVMFVLFTTANGAVAIHEERETGILGRILAGPAGAGPLIDGRFFCF